MFEILKKKSLTNYMSFSSMILKNKILKEMKLKLRIQLEYPETGELDPNL